MLNNQTTKKFDLEDRTLKLAKKVIDLLKQLPRNSINLEMTNQTVGSAGSIGANYREANVLNLFGKLVSYLLVINLTLPALQYTPDPLPQPV